MEQLGITLKCLVIPWDQTVIPITPHDVVQLTADVADALRGPGRSDSHGRQPGGERVTRRRNCYQRHGPRSLDGSFVVLFEAPLRRLMVASSGKTHRITVSNFVFLRS